MSKVPGNHDISTPDYRISYPAAVDYLSDRKFLIPESQSRTLSGTRGLELKGFLVTMMT